MNKKIALSLTLLAGLGLSACTDPYDPGQRALGGAAIGAGTGALIGGVAGGGRGAGIGALVGGGVGALGGAATTPNRPQYVEEPVYYQPAQPVYRQRRYGY